MITPRRTRLVRVHDLPRFRRALAVLALGDDSARAQTTAVLVPTKGAARQLRRAFASQSAGSNLPHLVTRDELYDLFSSRLSDSPSRLNALEREVLMTAAAQSALASGADPGFRLRAGLVAEMLRFYDQLRRQGQSVTRFEALIVEQLATDLETDRGAARSLDQTRFLAAAFRHYQERLAALGVCDEHLLREALVATTASDPLRHVVVSVGDWIGDPNGLFRADFDLLTRIPSLESIDIVATTALLGSGMDERIANWLPDIERVDADELGVDVPSSSPRLITPSAEMLPFFCRDREEELVTAVRRIAAARRREDGPPLERTAVVYRQPLPYLYVARETFKSARMPFAAADTLPLAAEPAAAALDLALEFVSSRFTRAEVVALLRSPHFRFARDGQPIDRREVSGLDRCLSEGRYLGELAALLAVASADQGTARALDAARDAARSLAPLLDPAPASQQIAILTRFLDDHVKADAPDGFAERHRRAWTAIRDLLAGLSAAYRAHYDEPTALDDLAVAIHRWIEEQTFAVDADEGGVQLVDDQAARYGEFDDMTIVGLVDGEWPERPRRNIFYTSSLLAALGWPSEADRRGAAEARFADLLRSPSGSVAVSTFTLEDDALVEPSVLLDVLARAGISTVAANVDPSLRVFVDEAIAREPLAADALDPAAREWLDLRVSRPSPDRAEFHGETGVRPPRPWSISALETYLTCPFKFFAQYVLALEDEPDDEEVMDPRSEGEFVHQVFEQFFREWQRTGGRSVTRDNIDAARELFAKTVDRLIERLPENEAALARTRLLGSPAAAGLGEAVLRMEAERPVPVVDRLLEERLEGEFVFQTADGPRTIRLRGKADRIDRLADGTFRMIDYKLGWPPDRQRALQLPIYSLCAEQRLSERDGRQWTVSEAAYVAFKGPRRVVPLFRNDSAREEVLAKAQQRLADTLDAIAAGHFPPTPVDVFWCESCSFAGVCRKDYVGDV